MRKPNPYPGVVFPVWVVAYTIVHWEQNGREVRDLKGHAIGVYL